MAQLISPGVSVTVVDETQTISAGTGTIPLIILATAANKYAPDGTTIAPGTQETGVLRLNTSQRDLLQRYGNPIFETSQGSVVQASETSEYGLHQAFSYMGVANTCYTIRADIDLKQLAFSTVAPTSPPANGTHWFNLTNTVFGIFKANGNSQPGLAWDPVVPKIPTASELTSNVPSTSFGSNGDVAIVTSTTNNAVYEKISGNWHNIGSTAWRAARPTVATGSAVSPVLTVSNTLIINGTTITLSGTSVAALVSQINGNGTLSAAGITSSGTTQIVITNSAGTDITIGGNARTVLGLQTTYAGYNFTFAPHTSIPVGTRSGDFWIKTTTPNLGANYVVSTYNVSTAQFAVKTAPFYANDSAATTGYGSALAIGSLYVQYNPTNASPALAAQVIKRYSGTAWAVLTYTASKTAPTSAPLADTLWINKVPKLDIMVVGSSGTEWRGYLNAYPGTNATGPIISATEPTTQSNGNPLIANDLWLNTSNPSKFSELYRWNSITSKWVLIDTTDQTTPYGIVFADARPNADGTLTGAEDMPSMLASDFVDADAPNPASYPAGMLLWNTRFSTMNVKQWKPTHFATQGSYTVGTATFTAPTYASRWVSASGNDSKGRAYLGRFAQHQMVVEAFNALITTNDAIRSDFNFYNLMSCPGYPEVFVALQDLNIDRKETAFIVADVPLHLKDDGTTIQNWATNAANVDVTGEDGRTNRYTYAAQYYPHGLGVNTDGNSVVVPASTIAMRTYAYNDSVAYVWTPPAGFHRGQVQNASSVGYVDATTGEYLPVVLNQGQRDVLYTNAINPIVFLPNRGLTVYGDKTLTANIGGSESRVNVARLVCYLRYQLDQLAQPFLFELNNDSTRQAAESTFKRFMSDLMGAGALEDFAVDVSRNNNTPTTIALNQLWIDIALVPAKSINFIYIPIRLKTEIQG